LHVLGDYKALGTLRFRHLGQHYMKPGDLSGHPHLRDIALFPKCRAAGSMS